MMAASRFAGFPDILTVPHQPSSCFAFPKRPFGKQNRSFQRSWFIQWKFLHYDEANDTVFCHTCVSAFKEGKMKSSCAEPAFVSNNYSFINSERVSVTSSHWLLAVQLALY